MGSGSSKAFKQQEDEVVVPDIPKSGVTLAFLHRVRELQSEHGWPESTAEVVNYFVKPATEALRVLINEASKKGPATPKKGEVVEIGELFVGSSLAQVMKRSYSDTAHPSLQMTYSQCYGETATVFVSHAWNSPFSELVAALDCFVAEQQQLDNTWLFWIDAFVADQWATVPLSQYPIEWYTDVFPAFVALIGRTVMVMSPGATPVALTRSWCLWEAICTLKQQQQRKGNEKGQLLHLAMSGEAKASFVAALEQVKTTHSLIHIPSTFPILTLTAN